MGDGTFLDHLGSSALVLYGIQWLKGRGWYQRFARWVPIADQHVHRVVSALGAFVAAVGIHIAVTGSATLGWHLSATIPPLMVLLEALKDWAEQFALQQFLYDGVVQKAGSTVILAHGPHGPVL